MKYWQQYGQLESNIREAFVYYYEILPGEMFLKYTSLKNAECWDVKPSSSVYRYTLVDHFDIPTKTQVFFPGGII